MALRGVVRIASILAPLSKLRKHDSNPLAALRYLAPADALK
jgi:hypothetical protein